MRREPSAERTALQAGQGGFANQVAAVTGNGVPGGLSLRAEATLPAA